MADHRFKEGQSVDWHAPKGVYQTAGRFSVMKRLPSDARGNYYRLKSESESHERVVAESELTAALSD
jgi:hypothetical protein